MCAHQEEFKQLHTRVFIISFGSFPAIQQWMKEVCDTFNVLMDRDRVVYRAYQLERSRLRARHPRVVWMYIKRWLRHEEFHTSHGDDTSQLGGDFIVDQHGILRLVHPSHDPTDRPSVEELLNVIVRLS